MIVLFILMSTLMRKYISGVCRIKTSNKAVQVCEAQLNAVNSVLKENHNLLDSHCDPRLCFQRSYTSNRRPGDNEWSSLQFNNKLKSHHKAKKFGAMSGEDKSNFDAEAFKEANPKVSVGWAASAMRSGDEKKNTTHEGQI